MSLTLGEKLRQAREEKGMAISEVADQTRISPLYIESIENDDYRALPGGIFNRGFVKSFAKYVGVDEQEALLDYAKLLDETHGSSVEQIKTYRPEVLTDEYTASSNVPTVIAAVIVLALMTGGILFLVNYLRRPPERSSECNATNTNTNAVVETAATATPTPLVPDMATSTFEIKAIGQNIRVTATVDTEPSKLAIIAAGTSMSFSPKESLTLSYIRWNYAAVQLMVNGKQIALPTEPLDPKDKDHIVFTVSRSNLAQIWTNQAINISTALALGNPAVNSNTEPPRVQPTVTVPRPATTPKPSVPANTTAKPPADNKMTNTAKPPTTIKTSPKPANKPQ